MPKNHLFQKAILYIVETFFKEIGAIGSYHESYVRSLRISYPDTIEELLSIVEKLYKIKASSKEDKVLEGRKKLFQYKYCNEHINITLNKRLKIKPKDYVLFIKELNGGFILDGIELKVQTINEEIICVHVGYLSESDLVRLINHLTGCVKAIINLHNLPKLLAESFSFSFLRDESKYIFYLKEPKGILNIQLGKEMSGVDIHPKVEIYLEDSSSKTLKKKEIRLKDIHVKTLVSDIENFIRY